MKHLEAVIENHVYKERYVSELATNLDNQLQLLSKIAETEPQTAYAAVLKVI